MAIGDPGQRILLPNGQMGTYSEYMAMTSQPAGNPTPEQIATLTPQQMVQQKAAAPYTVPDPNIGTGIKPEPVNFTPSPSTSRTGAAVTNTAAELVRRIAGTPISNDPFTADVTGSNFTITRAVVQPSNGPNAGTIAYEGYFPDMPSDNKFVVGTVRPGGNISLASAAMNWALAHPEAQFDTPEGIAAMDAKIYNDLVGQGQIKPGQTIYTSTDSGGASRQVNPYSPPKGPEKFRLDNKIVVLPAGMGASGPEEAHAYLSKLKNGTIVRSENSPALQIVWNGGLLDYDSDLSHASYVIGKGPSVAGPIPEFDIGDEMKYQVAGPGYKGKSGDYTFGPVYAEDDVSSLLSGSGSGSSGSSGKSTGFFSEPKAGGYVNPLTFNIGGKTKYGPYFPVEADPRLRNLLTDLNKSPGRVDLGLNSAAAAGRDATQQEMEALRAHGIYGLAELQEEQRKANEFEDKKPGLLKATDVVGAGLATIGGYLNDVMDFSVSTITSPSIARPLLGKQGGTLAERLPSSPIEQAITYKSKATLDGLLGNQAGEKKWTGLSDDAYTKAKEPGVFEKVVASGVNKVSPIPIDAGFVRGAEKAAILGGAFFVPVVGSEAGLAYLGAQLGTYGASKVGLAEYDRQNAGKTDMLGESLKGDKEMILPEKGGTRVGDLLPYGIGGDLRVGPFLFNPEDPGGSAVNDFLMLYGIGSAARAGASAGARVAGAGISKGAGYGAVMADVLGSTATREGLSSIASRMPGRQFAGRVARTPGELWRGANEETPGTAGRTADLMMDTEVPVFGPGMGERIGAAIGDTRTAIGRTKIGEVLPVGGKSWQAFGATSTLIDRAATRGASIDSEIASASRPRGSNFTKTEPSGTDYVMQQIGSTRIREVPQAIRSSVRSAGTTIRRSATDALSDALGFDVPGAVSTLRGDMATRAPVNRAAAAKFVEQAHPEFAGSKIRTDGKSLIVETERGDINLTREFRRWEPNPKLTGFELQRAISGLKWAGLAGYESVARESSMLGSASKAYTDIAAESKMSAADRLEHLLTFDEGGNAVTGMRGTERSVRPSGMSAAEFNNLAASTFPGSRVWHSHPDETPMSVSDAATAAERRPSEMIMTTPSGETSVFRIGKGADLSPLKSAIDTFKQTISGRGLGTREGALYSDAIGEGAGLLDEMWATAGKGKGVSYEKYASVDEMIGATSRNPSILEPVPGRTYTGAEGTAYTLGRAVGKAVPVAEELLGRIPTIEDISIGIGRQKVGTTYLRDVPRTVKQGVRNTTARAIDTFDKYTFDPLNEVVGDVSHTAGRAQFAAKWHAGRLYDATADSIYNAIDPGIGDYDGRLLVKEEGKWRDVTDEFHRFAPGAPVNKVSTDPFLYRYHRNAEAVRAGKSMAGKYADLVGIKIGATKIGTTYLRDVPRGVGHAVEGVKVKASHVIDPLAEFADDVGSAAGRGYDAAMIPDAYYGKGGLTGAASTAYDIGLAAGTGVRTAGEIYGSVAPALEDIAIDIGQQKVGTTYLRDVPRELKHGVQRVKAKASHTFDPLGEFADDVSFYANRAAFHADYYTASARERAGTAAMATASKAGRAGGNVAYTGRMLLDLFVPETPGQRVADEIYTRPPNRNKPAEPAPFRSSIDEIMGDAYTGEAGVGTWKESPTGSKNITEILGEERAKTIADEMKGYDVDKVTHLGMAAPDIKVETPFDGYRNEPVAVPRDVSQLARSTTLSNIASDKAVRNEMAKMNAYTKRTGRERAAIIDVTTGKVLQRAYGDSRGVEIAAGDRVKQAIADGHKVVSVHTHTSGGFASTEDIVGLSASANAGEPRYALISNPRTGKVYGYEMAGAGDDVAKLTGLSRVEQRAAVNIPTTDALREIIGSTDAGAKRTAAVSNLWEEALPGHLQSAKALGVESYVGEFGQKPSLLARATDLLTTAGSRGGAAQNMDRLVFGDPMADIMGEGTIRPKKFNELLGIAEGDLAQYRRPRVNDEWSARTAKDSEIIVNMNAEAIGVDAGTYRAMLEDRASRLFETATPVINRHPQGAINVLESGRFKTQFETRKSGGAYNPKLRMQIERDLYGYSHGDVPEGLEPVYGWLSDREIPMSSEDVSRIFGNVSFVLKPEVMKRTTFTRGDSLDEVLVFNEETGKRTPLPVIAPSSVRSPRHVSIMEQRVAASRHTTPDVFMDYLKGKPVPKDLRLEYAAGSLRDVSPAEPFGKPYYEAQIHGGVGLDDVAEIVTAYKPDVVSKPVRGSSLESSVMLASDLAMPTIARLTEERGIPWTTWKEKAKAAGYETEYDAYNAVTAQRRPALNAATEAIIGRKVADPMADIFYNEARDYVRENRGDAEAIQGGLYAMLSNKENDAFENMFRGFSGHSGSKDALMLRMTTKDLGLSDFETLGVTSDYVAAKATPMSEQDRTGAVGKTYLYTQAYLDEIGVPEFALFRGVNKGKTLDPTTGEWIRSGVESFTPSPTVARKFGDYVIRTNAPKERVLATPETVPTGFENEREYLMLSPEKVTTLEPGHDFVLSQIGITAPNPLKASRGWGEPVRPNVDLSGEVRGRRVADPMADMLGRGRGDEKFSIRDVLGLNKKVVEPGYDVIPAPAGRDYADFGSMRIWKVVEGHAKEETERNAAKAQRMNEPTYERIRVPTDTEFEGFLRAYESMPGAFRYFAEGRAGDVVFGVIEGEGYQGYNRSLVSHRATIPGKPEAGLIVVGEDFKPVVATHEMVHHVYPSLVQSGFDFNLFAKKVADMPPFEHAAEYAYEGRHWTPTRPRDDLTPSIRGGRMAERRFATETLAIVGGWDRRGMSTGRMADLISSHKHAHEVISGIGIDEEIIGGRLNAGARVAEPTVGNRRSLSRSAIEDAFGVSTRKPTVKEAERYTAAWRDLVRQLPDVEESATIRRFGDPMSDLTGKPVVKRRGADSEEKGRYVVPAVQSYIGDIEGVRIYRGRSRPAKADEPDIFSPYTGDVALTPKELSGIYKFDDRDVMPAKPKQPEQFGQPYTGDITLTPKQLSDIYTFGEAEAEVAPGRTLRQALGAVPAKISEIRRGGGFVESYFKNKYGEYTSGVGDKTRPTVSRRALIWNTAREPGELGMGSGYTTETLRKAGFDFLADDKTRVKEFERFQSLADEYGAATGQSDLLNSIIGSMRALDTAPNTGRAPSLRRLFGDDAPAIERAILKVDPGARVVGSASSRLRSPADLDLQVTDASKVTVEQLAAEIRAEGVQDVNITKNGKLYVDGKKIDYHDIKFVEKMQGKGNLSVPTKHVTTTPGGVLADDEVRNLQNKLSGIVADIGEPRMMKGDEVWQDLGVTRGRPWRAGKEVADVFGLVELGEKEGWLRGETLKQLQSTTKKIETAEFLYGGWGEMPSIGTGGQLRTLFGKKYKMGSVDTARDIANPVGQPTAPEVVLGGTSAPKVFKILEQAGVEKVPTGGKWIVDPVLAEKYPRESSWYSRAYGNVAQGVVRMPKMVTSDIDLLVSDQKGQRLRGRNEYGAVRGSAEQMAGEFPQYSRIFTRSAESIIGLDKGKYRGAAESPDLQYVEILGAEDAPIFEGAINTMIGPSVKEAVQQAGKYLKSKYPQGVVEVTDDTVRFRGKQVFDIHATDEPEMDLAPPMMLTPRRSDIMRRGKDYMGGINAESLRYNAIRKHSAVATNTYNALATVKDYDPVRNYKPFVRQAKDLPGAIKYDVELGLMTGGRKGESYIKSAEELARSKVPWRESETAELTEISGIDLLNSFIRDRYGYDGPDLRVSDVRRLPEILRGTRLGAEEIAMTGKGITKAATKANAKTTADAGTAADIAGARIDNVIGGRAVPASLVTQRPRGYSVDREYVKVNVNMSRGAKYVKPASEMDALLGNFMRGPAVAATAATGPRPAPARQGRKPAPTDFEVPTMTTDAPKAKKVGSVSGQTTGTKKQGGFLDDVLGEKPQSKSKSGNSNKGKTDSILDTAIGSPRGKSVIDAISGESKQGRSGTGGGRRDASDMMRSGRGGMSGIGSPFSAVFGGGLFSPRMGFASGKPGGQVHGKQGGTKDTGLFGKNELGLDEGPASMIEESYAGSGSHFINTSKILSAAMPSTSSHRGKMSPSKSIDDLLSPSKTPPSKPSRSKPSPSHTPSSDSSTPSPSPPSKSSGSPSPYSYSPGSYSKSPGKPRLKLNLNDKRRRKKRGRKSGLVEIWANPVERWLE